MINKDIHIFVIKILLKPLPSLFNNYYENIANSHGLNTRHGCNLRKVKHETKIGALSIKIHGPVLWNKLDANLKSLMYKKSILPYRPT